jgi:hypothetical protein
MVHKVKKRIKKTKMSSTLDLSAISRSSRHDSTEQVHKVLDYLSGLERDKNYRLIRKLASNPLLPQILTNRFSIGSPMKTYNFDGIVSLKSYFYWQIGLFENNMQAIREFNYLRAKINQALLFDDPRQCIAFVDKINLLTINWWCCEIRTHISKDFLKIDFKEPLEQLAKIIGEDRHQLKYIKVMSESSMDIHTKLLVDQLLEYETAGLENIINFGKCLRLLYLSPHRLLSVEAGECSLDIMKEYHGHPIIDQYVLFKSILASYAGDFSSLEPHKLRIIAELSNLLDDEELQNLLNTSEKENEYVQVVLDEYTTGNYINVIKSIKENSSREVFGLIEVYARAKVYAGDSRTENLFDTIAFKLGEILQVKPESNDHINFIITLCNKFRHEEWAKCLHYHLSKILHERYDKRQIEALRIQSLALGNLNTPKVLIKDFIPNNFSLFRQEKVPFDRSIRYDKKKQQELKITKTMFPISSDYLKIQSKIYLEKGDISSLADFICQNHFKNNLSYLFLPISKACNVISDIHHEKPHDRISFMIVLDIYSKMFNKKYDDLKTDIFEDFIAAAANHQPSRLFECDKASNRELYFLRHICTTSQLDSIVHFTSNDEVVIERVSIIDFLINYHKLQKNRSEVITLLQERESALESLFAENLRAKLETGKLYVDVQAIEARNKHIYEAYYKKAKSLEGGILLDADDETKASNDIYHINENNSVIASSRKMDLIVDLFYQCVRDFASSEEFGLDKYLSAEIRHNVFFGQIRSCFEKSSLVTEHSDEGYASNSYWLHKYNYISDKFMASVDRRLMRFSEDLDRLVDDFNHRLRVVTHNESNAIFDFSCYYARAYELSRIIDNANNFSSFFQEMIDFMWSIAELYAKSCQQIIDESFKPSVYVLIEELERDLTSLRGKTAIVSLMDEVRLVKSSFSNEIENVINWFRFVGKSDREGYEPTEVVIEATISSFMAVYGHKSQDLEVNLGKSNNILSYRESRALFICLFTTLENSLTYRSSNSKFKLEHHIDEKNDDIITVTNETNAFSTNIQADNFIAEVKEVWNSDNSELNVLEGGTGLYKMHDYLYKCSDRFSLDIVITTCLKSFITIVNIKHENFTH